MAQHETSFEGAEPQTFEDCVVANDRRRLGRLDRVSPTLIPLLRTTPTPDLPLKDNADLALSEEKLAPAAATGIILLLSTLLWGAIGFTWWAIVR